MLKIKSHETTSFRLDHEITHCYYPIINKLHPQSTIKSIWMISNNLFSARLRSADRLRQLSYQNTDARVLRLIRNILSPERESHALLLSSFMPLIQDLIVFVKHGIQISSARIRRYRNFIVVQIKEIKCSNFFRDSVKLRCHPVWK